MKVEKILKTISKEEQLKALKEHLDYLKKITKEPGFDPNNEEVFMLDYKKEIHGDDTTYTLQKNRAIRALSYALGLRLIKSGDFEEYALFAHPKLVRRIVNDGEVTNEFRTEFNGSYTERITSKNGFFKQEVAFRQALSDEVKKLIDREDYTALEDMKFTWIGADNWSFEYHFHVTAEVDKKNSTYKTKTLVKKN